MVDNKRVKLEYLPTEDMKADILTKPLTGKLFYKMKNWLLNKPEDID